MEIDLAKVLTYSKDCLQSRAQMRSIMMDMYPGKIRDINILLSVYESGIPKRIKSDGSINETQYASYVQKVIDDYGLNELFVVDALDAWIDICIKPGTAASLNKRKIGLEKTKGDAYTHPIVHNSPNTNITPVVGQVSDYEIKDVGNGSVEISKFVGFDQADTVIPTEINGKRVIGIGDNAYKQCKGIQRLIIPEGIEYVSEGAFCECTNLKSVILPTSLKYLGRKDNSRYTTSYNENGVFQGTVITEIDLPNSITIIEDYSFYECKYLTKIQFPDELKTIGSWAFSSCKSLTNVVLPSKVETLEHSAFGFCDQLTDVTLNEGLKAIKSWVFQNDPALTFLVIPRSVTEFGDDIIGSGRRGTSNITIGCYPGSKAIEYARLHNLQIIDVTK